MKYKKLDGLFDKRGKKRVMALMRIGHLAHLEEIQKGKLRFTSPTSYSEASKADSHVFDKNEDLQAIFQSALIAVTLKRPGLDDITISKENGLTGQILQHQSDDALIMCFYGMNAGEWENKEISEEQLIEFLSFLRISKEMDSFGKHVLLVLNPSELFERVKRKIIGTGLSLSARLVEYIDFEEFHGEIPAEDKHFVKSIKYEYQREFRVRLIGLDRLLAPFHFDVGDLSDICKIVSIEELRKSLTIRIGDKDVSHLLPEDT